MLVPGIVAGKAAAGGYHASAVHFAGDGNTYLNIASLTAPGDSTGFCSYSLWFNGTSWANGSAMFVADPENNYTSDLETRILATVHETRSIFADATDANTIFASTNVVSAGWHNLLVSVQTNLGVGSKILQMYLDDISSISAIADTHAAFLMTYNGKSFWIGDDGFSDSYSGDLADVWIAPGVFVDFSVTANRRKFISAAGKPVDPSGFPASAMLFSGNATGFLVNQGTGGAFTANGTITNASTSPSD